MISYDLFRAACGFIELVKRRPGVRRPGIEKGASGL